MNHMTRKKATERIKELEKQETNYFDTYRRHKNDADKVQHLRAMADVIEEKAKLKTLFNIR